MTHKESELLASTSYQQALKRLKQIREPLGPPEPPNKKALLLALLKRIPLLSGFLHSIDGAGNALSKLAMAQGNFSSAVQNASRGFQIGGAVLAGIDFVRIPLIYLAAYMLGEKLPFSLSKNARLIYSAVLLGIAITAVAFPPVAPIMAMTAAVLGLGLSLVTLGKHLHSIYQAKKELKSINLAIKLEETNLENLQEQATIFERQLTAAIQSDNQEEASHLSTQIDKLSEDFEKLKQAMHNLQNRRISREDKLKRLGGMGITDKLVGIAVSSLALAGIVLSLFFPPAGLALIAASAVAGGLYVLGRVGFPLLKQAWNSLLGKGKATGVKIEAQDDDNTENEQKELLEESKQISPEPTPEPSHDLKSGMPSHSSTLQAELNLEGPESPSILRRKLDHLHWVDNTERELDNAIEHSDQRAILRTFNQIAIHFQNDQHNVNQNTIEDLLEEFECTDAALALLKQAKQAVIDHQLDISPTEINALLDSEPLRVALQKRQIHFQPLIDALAKQGSGENEGDGDAEREGIKEKVSNGFP
ncbi:coiled-coil protein [Legionella birminghamensis]|uniref:Coiled-coil protein n=1 Tax=Legionella birminghamensis TaxID=28083 RepID=A0A378IED4_9GAMM|nr:hypothetical protein [Legionella birminghamensis]KTC75327.1 coiled-coil protein [Legionella birminghamensis]STX33095.1 coiled-coil protein [Legionella birminghamensis]